MQQCIAKPIKHEASFLHFLRQQKLFLRFILGDFFISNSTISSQFTQDLGKLRSDYFLEKMQIWENFVSLNITERGNLNRPFIFNATLRCTVA